MVYLLSDPKATGKPILKGRSFAHSKISVRQRAALGAQLVLGEITIEPTMTQAAALVGASIPYISAAYHLPSNHRASLAEGYMLPLVVESKVTPLKTVPKVVELVVVLPAPVFSDAYLADIIRTVGVNRLLDLCEVEVAAA